ncbi:SPFH domain-containing protein [Spirosoma aerolatum]|uniref:SPFH domain-containing protein n=1 Tax=Spirosoma aerolatum TaxID=1211326 RepID=UPI0009AEE598|nr:SPFH domain-containing protein [Spirosoma aerolatum]
MIKKLTLAAILLVVIVLFLANSCTTVDASHEGIKVSKIGSDRGASDIENVTGWIFYNPFTSFIEQYPTFTQTKDFDPFNVSAKGGTLFKIDPTLNYHLVKGQGANVYRKYRKELPDIENNILRTIVYNSYRDVANGFSPDSLVNNRVGFEEQVEAKLRKALSDDGFAFENITSNLTPPESLQAMIDAKNTAVQNALRLQNQIAAEKASAEIAVTKANGIARAKIIEAEAEARANELKQKTLTPLLVQQEWIKKWNGQLPTTQLGSGTSTLIQLPTK